MKHVLQNSKIVLFAGLFIIVIGTSAWQLQTYEKTTDESSKQACSDTTKPGTIHSDKIDLRINTDSMFKAAQASLSAIDFTKLQQEINASLASVNFDEISKSIESSIKSIDWDKMKIDVEKSLNEAKAEMANVNTKDIKESLEKAKAELKSEQLKQKIDLSGMQKNFDESMAKARKEIEKARLETVNYRNFITVLQSDGLVKAGEPYKVELKDNVLYINSIKQSKETTEKYRKYYQGKTHFSIYDNKDQKEEDENDTDNNGTDL